jgi:hypothetical protein
MRILTSALWVLMICCPSFVLQRAAGEVKSDSPLKIRISAPRSSVCLGDKAFIIDVVVINEGQSKISFDSGHVRVDAGYLAIFDTTTMKFRTEGMSIQQDRIPTSSESFGNIELLPGQAYVRQFSFPLPKPFFDEPGFYHLMPSVSIDAFSPKADPKSGLIFEVRDCN